MTGTNYTVSIPDIRSKIGIPGKVDGSHIIVRGPIYDCRFIAVNRHADSVTFKVDMATQKAWNFNYTVFLLSAENNTNYALIDDFADQNSNWAKLNFAPNCTYWHATDLVAGPESAILNAVNQLNNALAIPGFTYGKISKVNAAGDFRVYYSNEFPSGGVNGFDNIGHYAKVNPNNLKDFQMLCLWLEEIFENMTKTDDLGGLSSNRTITDYGTTGNLNQTGVDLLCYVYAKDTQWIGAR
jgi:hypothetical protein